MLYKILTPCVHPGFQYGLNKLPIDWYYTKLPTDDNDYWAQRPYSANVHINWNVSNTELLNPDFVILHTVSQALWWSHRYGNKYRVIFMYHTCGDMQDSCSMDEWFEIENLIQGRLITHGDTIPTSALVPNPFYMQHIVDLSEWQCVPYKKDGKLICLDSHLIEEAYVNPKLDLIANYPLYIYGTHNPVYKNERLNGGFINDYKDLIDKMYNSNYYLTLKMESALHTSAIEAMCMGIPAVVPDSYEWTKWGNGALKYKNSLDFKEKIDYIYNNEEGYKDLTQAAFIRLEALHTAAYQWKRWEKYLGGLQ